MVEEEETMPMLIRSQDGKAVVETSSVWIQSHADSSSPQRYIFAATEFDPEGLCMGQYSSETEAKTVLERILYKAELNEAIDLYRETGTGDDQSELNTLSLVALRVAAKRFGTPKNLYGDFPAASSNRETCPKCYTPMEDGESGIYCPKCEVTA